MMCPFRRLILIILTLLNHKCIVLFYRWKLRLTDFGLHME